MGCVQTSDDEKSLKEFYLSYKCTDYIQCENLKRLKTMLKYHNEWVLCSDQDATVDIMEYINNKCIDNGSCTMVLLLQDYYHLINYHGSEFEDIYNYFCDDTIKCSMDSCSMITRNHRSRDANNSTARCQYYRACNSRQVITQQIFDQIHCYIYHTFDIGFKLTKQEEIHIYEQKQQVNQHDIDIIVDDENIEDYKRWQLIGNVMQRKKQQIHAIRSRNQLGENNKFMSNHDEIQNFKQDTMFSFGVRYYYDAPLYKNNQQLDVKYNKGYTYSHWFIDKKYPNLKTEALTNNTSTLSKQQYKDLYYKSGEYLKTEHVLKNYKNMIIEHLVCIMIYCNFDTLQCEFTKTYRHGLDEHDEALKIRHSEFANFGELLQKTVEINGTKVGKGKTKIFYHGINTELMFTSTLHKFCGPLSTSSEYEVALVFTKNNGIILELKDGTLYTDECNSIYFDCEWISDFGYEKEKFFMGGFEPLQIVSIFHVKLNQNYGTYIKLITILLAIIEGDISLNNKEELTEKNVKAIVKLLKHELEDPKLEIIPKYVTRLLHHICMNITTFTTRYNSTFDVDIKENYKYKSLSQFLCCNDCQLFQLNVLRQLFPNLTSIAIECSLLTDKVFDNILQFLRANKSKIDEIALNNIVFQAPILPSTSFATIENKYGASLKELDWMLQIENEDKRLTIKQNKKNVEPGHCRDASTNVENAKRIFNKTERFVVASSLSDYDDNE